MWRMQNNLKVCSPRGRDECAFQFHCWYRAVIGLESSYYNVHVTISMQGSLIQYNLLMLSWVKYLKFEQSHTKFIAYTVPECQLKKFDELKYIDQDAQRVKEALCMNEVVQEKMPLISTQTMYF